MKAFATALLAVSTSAIALKDPKFDNIFDIRWQLEHFVY